MSEVPYPGRVVEAYDAVLMLMQAVDVGTDVAAVVTTVYADALEPLRHAGRLEEWSQTVGAIIGGQVEASTYLLMRLSEATGQQPDALVRDVMTELRERLEP